MTKILLVVSILAILVFVNTVNGQEICKRHKTEFGDYVEEQNCTVYCCGSCDHRYCCENKSSRLDQTCKSR